MNKLKYNYFRYKGTDSYHKIFQFLYFRPFIQDGYDESYNTRLPKKINSTQMYLLNGCDRLKQS